MIEAISKPRVVIALKTHDDVYEAKRALEWALLAIDVRLDEMDPVEDADIIERSVKIRSALNDLRIAVGRGE